MVAARLMAARLHAGAILERVLVLWRLRFVLGCALGLNFGGLKNTTGAEPTVSQSLSAALERVGERIDAVIDHLQLEGVLMKNERDIFAIPNDGTLLDIAAHAKPAALSLPA